MIVFPLLPHRSVVFVSLVSLVVSFSFLIPDAFDVFSTAEKGNEKKDSNDSQCYPYMYFFIFHVFPAFCSNFTRSDKRETSLLSVLILDNKNPFHGGLVQQNAAPEKCIDRSLCLSGKQKNKGTGK